VNDCVARGRSLLSLTALLIMVALLIGQTIIFLPCDFSLLSAIFFFSSPNLSGRRLDIYHTSTHGVRGPSANLECRSEMCCSRLAANTGRKKVAKNRHLGHHRTISTGYIFANKARIDNRKKRVKQQYLPSSTCFTIW